MTDLSNSGSVEQYFSLDRPTQTVARWRIFNIILAIPMLIINWFVSIVAYLAWWGSIITVLFLGRIPQLLYDIQVASTRFQFRVFSFIDLNLNVYPPLDFITDPEDPHEYPARVNYPPLPDRVSRLAIFRPILIIPHYFWLLLLMVWALILGIVSFFSVLILGRFPMGIQDFIIKFNNYILRLAFYIEMIKPGYPSFALG